MNIITPNWIYFYYLINKYTLSFVEIGGGEYSLIK